MPNPSRSPSRFSKREPEEYRDAEDALYRSFRDAEGSVHWDAFNSPEGRQSCPEVRGNSLDACYRLNAIMPENSGIDGSAHMLDLGRDDARGGQWERYGTSAALRRALRCLRQNG